MHDQLTLSMDDQIRVESHDAWAEAIFASWNMISVEEMF